MSDRRAVRFWVSGRVQGVGFRWFTRKAAQELALSGRVRNLPDGRVEVEAAGEPGRLEAFRGRLRQGPPGARVTGLEEQEISPVPDGGGFAIDR
ncbi:MAG TPA: acylphosphatase [Thermoanaerobaculia bacterium]|jgi:acylphosphatase